MFLLVSVRHVGAHLGEHQHGVSIEISTSLGETFLRISRIRNIPLPWILARVFVYVPLSFLRLWTLFTEWFWFLFWCILNDVTLKPAIALRSSPPLLGTSALGSSPFGIFVSWNAIDWSILIPKNKNWKLITTFNFEFSSKFTSL